MFKQVFSRVLTRFFRCYRCYNSRWRLAGRGLTKTPIQFVRIVEAAGFVLKGIGGKTTKLPLLKLMYIADRESIRRTGRSISRDGYAAMENGPILSTTYDMMKGPELFPLWRRYFSSGKDVDEVALNGDPGVNHLSNLDVEILNWVLKNYGKMSPAQLRELTHDFPEYLKREPGGPTSNPITMSDVLDALGQSDRKAKIDEDERKQELADKIFSKYSG